MGGVGLGVCVCNRSGSEEDSHVALPDCTMQEENGMDPYGVRMEERKEINIIF